MEKKPRIHKTLLLLILVLVPPFWLLFTEQGARVSDSALLWLLGEQDIRLSLAELDRGFTRSDIVAVYREHSWQCRSRTTALGDSLCAASIGTFNGLPARLLIFYFRTDQLSAMKLIYRVPYHKQILSHCIASLGQPDNVAAAIAAGPAADAVLEWHLPSGTLVLKKTLGEPDEPALLWIATQAVPGTTGAPRRQPSAATS